MDDSISLDLSYSLSVFLVLWLFYTKIWNVVFWVCLLFWAGLHRRRSRKEIVFCFAPGKKRRKRVCRLLCTPCSFSSFSYNPADKTGLATARTGFVFEEILKKDQFGPLSPSHQPKKKKNQPWENEIKPSIKPAVVQWASFPFTWMIQLT